MLPTAAVAAVLRVALKRDIKQQESSLSAMTSDLLDLWQQCCPPPATQQLTAESATMLAILLTRDKRWPEAADVFLSRVDSNQVCMM